jgi:hypothetical protein
MEMIKIDNIEVFNFEGSLRGMRNPMNSWEKSDSFWKIDDIQERVELYKDNCGYVIGEKDLELAQRLISGGPVHSKFMRQIFVSMDIDAPLYWWKEMDTYKVGTTANSCSTMHKIHSNNIDKNLFSLDNSYSLNEYENEVIDRYLHLLEDLRVKSNNNDKEAWRLLIQLLPESWNQKRTWTADYETLRNIYQWRRNHKLNEWHDFCQMIEELPYGKELICYNIGGNNSEA